MRGGGPMFGEWGGLILQLTITVVVILGLIAVVYWLVRRYSGGGLGRLSRARVPRLAVIDAMAIDGRRRLILVRRDNVEHLILLGGPSDVVVEQAIQRQRQRPVARPQAVGTAAEMSPPSAEPAVSPPENPPIPFPQARIHQSPVHQPAPAPMAERTFAPARRAAQPQPTRYEATSAPAAAPLFQAIAEPLPPTPEPAPFETSVYEPRTIYAPTAATNGHQAHRDYGNGTSQLAAASPFIMPTPADSETAAKVNDLEREMARLLGEITANRPS
jgi:flagellar protein FliO/FliZ